MPNPRQNRQQTDPALWVVAGIFGVTATILLAALCFGLVMMGREGTSHSQTVDTVAQPVGRGGRPASPTASASSGTPATTGPLGTALRYAPKNGDQEADVMVSNLRRGEPGRFSHVDGELWIVDTVMTGRAGESGDNPMYYEAATAAGQRFRAALVAIDDGLHAGEVAPGETLSGPIAFDIPAGEQIVQIRFQQLVGTTLRWTV